MEDLKIFDENGKTLHIADVISRLFELERFDIDPQWNGKFTELEKRVESTGEFVSWRSVQKLISQIRKENVL
jgi:hypothetical protein